MIRNFICEYFIANALHCWRSADGWGWKRRFFSALWLFLHRSGDNWQRGLWTNEYWTMQDEASLSTSSQWFRDSALLGCAITTERFLFALRGSKGCRDLLYRLSRSKFLPGRCHHPPKKYKEKKSDLCVCICSVWCERWTLASSTHILCFGFSGVFFMLLEAVGWNENRLKAKSLTCLSSEGNLLFLDLFFRFRHNKYLHSLLVLDES